MGFASMVEDMVKRWDENHFGGHSGPSIGDYSAHVRTSGKPVPKAVEPWSYGVSLGPKLGSQARPKPSPSRPAKAPPAAKSRERAPNPTPQLEDLTPWLDYCESHLAHMSGRAISATAELGLLEQSGEKLRVQAEVALVDAMQFEESIRLGQQANRLPPAAAKGLADRCSKAIHEHAIIARRGLTDLKAAVRELSATKHCRQAVAIISKISDQLEDDVYRPITPTSKARCEALIQSAESLRAAVRELEKDGTDLGRALRATMKQLELAAGSMTKLESSLASFKQRMIRMGGKRAMGQED